MTRRALSASPPHARVADRRARDSARTGDRRRGSVGQDDRVPTVTLAQDPAADALLARDPLALLIGMLLDQQVPMERAFAGPQLLRTRLGHDLDAHELATYDPERLTALFVGPPAIHRFPGSMAQRVQALCRQLVERYDGDVEAVWRDVADGRELLRRLQELPGFGKQ